MDRWLGSKWPHGMKRMRVAEEFEGLNRSRHVVVCVDPKLRAVCRSFAHTQRRGFMNARSVEHIPAAPEVLSYLIIGGPREFTPRLLLSLSARLESPWGMVCAVDEQHLAVQLRNMSLQDRSSGDLMLLDDHDGRFRIWSREGRSKVGPIRNFRIPSRGPSWCVLVGHGEPGHLRCDGLVLCGAVTKQAIDPAGLPTQGCSKVSANATRCVRAESVGLKAIGFSHINARNLVVLSCSGLSLGYELSPTNVSSALSAIEGGTVGILASVANVAVSSRDVKMVLSLARQNVSLSDLRDALNDSYDKRYGFRPWVLYGEPRYSSGLMCGRNWIHTRASPRQMCSPPDSLRERGKMRKRLVQIQSAILRLRVLETATEAGYLQYLPDHANDLMLRAMTHRRRAEHLLHLAAATFSPIDPDYKTRAAPIFLELVDAISKANKVHAQLFIAGVWQSDFWLLLGYGGEFSKVSLARNPDVCTLHPRRHQLLRGSINMRLFGTETVEYTLCQTCGPKHITVGDISPPSLTTQTTMKREKRYCFSVRVEDASDDTEWVAVVAAERPTKRALYTRLIRAKKLPSRMCFTVPANLLTEAHVISACRFSLEGIASSTVRVVCY